MILKRSLLISLALISGGFPLVQAEEIISFSQRSIASNSIESSYSGKELDIEKPVITYDPSKCDEFDDLKSMHYWGPVKSTQPTNRVDRFILCPNIQP